MRIGIFGGSFDPPHTGHLLVALDAIEALSLDRLQVVPAAVQPLKTGQRTSAEHRLAMTRQCFGGLPRVEVDPIEIERGGLSFSVDTVEVYRRQWPSAALHLLVGEDAVAGFARWREPERLLSMVQMVVLSRSIDATTAPKALASSAMEEWLVRIGVQHPAQRLATRRVDVSSTEIRARVNEGRSIRGFVPDAVAAYIAAHNLYLQVPAALGDPTLV
ncbi:MAG: nicotinate (nicotinamide) nucleotide adenylyltransferase [Gemmatimonadaceae bacterium]